MNIRVSGANYEVKSEHMGKVRAMLHPSTKKLIDRLGEMTRKQKVSWTQGEDGQIFHDTEGYRVTILPEPHAIHVTDALGRPIETTTPDDFKNEIDSDGRPYEVFIADLYREADRHARGAEKAIDALMRGLDLDGDGIPDHLQDGPGQPINPALASAAGVAVAATPPEIEAEEPREALSEDLADDTATFEDFAEVTPSPAVEHEPIIETAETASEREMTEAVASMADQVNGTSTVPSEMVETGQDAMGQDIADFATPPPADTDMDTPSPFGTPIPMETSEEDTSPLPTTVTPPEETPNPVAPVAAAASGAAFFGRSMGNLNRYRTAPVETPTEVEAEVPEAGVEIETPDTILNEAQSAPSEPEQFAPSEEASVTTPPDVQRPFSLSGLSAGYGLGSAAATTPAQEPTPEPETSSIEAAFTDAPRKVIDGTADLPDIDLPMEMEEDSFKFGEPEAEVEAPTPAPDPMPEPAPAQAEPVQAAEAPEEPGKPAKPASRFNPWN